MIEQGKTVEQFIFSGDDLIKVIQKTNQPISILNSIITGGIKFNQLPEIIITKSILPSDWSDFQKDKYIEAKTKTFNTCYLVNNAITIINSEISIDSDNYRSIIAERVVFLKNVSFQGSIFKGESYWTDATFGSDSQFQGAQFQGKAYFMDALFYGIADFQDTFFASHGAVFIKAHFFSKHIRFSNARFRFASFRGAEFWGETDFSNTFYEKEAYFTDVNFYETTDFRNSHFSGAVFIRSVFHANVYFKKVQLHLASFQGVKFQKDAVFSETVFTGTTFFNNAEFKQLADFSSSEFKCSGTQFKEVKISGNAIFSKSRFEGTVLFSKIVFTGNQVYFNECSFLKSAYFVNAQIKSHDIDFHETIVHETINFQEAKFDGYSNFSECQFLQKTDFTNAIFQSEADFFHVTYQSNATFSGAKFLGDAEFSNNQFKNLSDFSDATFQHVSDFSGSHFKGKADFSKASFQSETLFRHVVFNEEGSFFEAIFHDTVDFFESIFQQLAYFKYSQFYHILRIKNVGFNGYVDFRNSLINKLDMYSQKSPTIIKNRVDYRNSWIGSAHLQDVVFEGDVDFSGVIFGGNESNDEKNSNAVVLRFVSFEGDSNFVRTVFLCDLSLEMLSSKGFMNFRDAQFKPPGNTQNNKIMLSYLNTSRIYIEWRQLPFISQWIRDEKDRIFSFADKELLDKPDEKKNMDLTIEPISEMLQVFEDIFQNRLADKNDVIYLRQCVELAEIREADEFSFLRLQKELEWFLWGMFTGYGTKIWWIIGWCLFFHMLFAIIYWWHGTLIRKYAATEDEHDYTFKQRLFDLPRLFLTEKKYLKINRGDLDRLVNAMRFSYVILFKFGYRDTTISGSFLGIDYTIIVWIEWILGFFLLSYLAVTLSNTMPLVNRLITGVF